MSRGDGMLAVGQAAPQVDLFDQAGERQRLADYKGKWVLLYFYPRDNTSGCTKEACAFRDSWKELKKLGVVVLGVSTDTVESHKKFAEKYTLPFPILADVEKKAVEAYGVWGMKSFMGRKFLGTRRMSFLISPAGKTAKIYEKVKPAIHAEEVISDLKSLV